MELVIVAIVLGFLLGWLVIFWQWEDENRKRDERVEALQETIKRFHEQDNTEMSVQDFDKIMKRIEMEKIGK